VSRWRSLDCELLVWHLHNAHNCKTNVDHDSLGVALSLSPPPAASPARLAAISLTVVIKLYRPKRTTTASVSLCIHTAHLLRNLGHESVESKICGGSFYHQFVQGILLRHVHVRFQKNSKQYSDRPMPRCQKADRFTHLLNMLVENYVNLRPARCDGDQNRQLAPYSLNDDYYRVTHAQRIGIVRY